MAGLVHRLDGQAVRAGLLTFAILYPLAAILSVFLIALLSAWLPEIWVYGSLRVFAALLLAMPGFVAGSLARRAPWGTASAVGLVCALAIVLTMTFTFSWDGTVRGEVYWRMPLVFVGVLALNLVAAWLALWLRERRTSAPVSARAR